MKNESLHSHLFMKALIDAFPEESHFLSCSTNEELVAGEGPESLIEHGCFNRYFVRNLFKKIQDLDLGYDPKDRAISDFKEFLKTQNVKGELLKELFNELSPNNDLYKILVEVRKIFAHALRDFSPNMIKPRYTSGATHTLSRGRSVFQSYKNPEGIGYLRKTSKFILIDELDALSEGSLANRDVYFPLIAFPFDATYKDDDDFFIKVDTVDKNAKTGRIIGKHQVLILAIQAGFGDYLESCLVRDMGIDIRTAPEIHQALAMEGSLTGDWATADQRNASNNITTLLLDSVLPTAVMEFANQITPRSLEIEGKRVNTIMAAPNGNGYIFPLQTMLYWAIATAVQRLLSIDTAVYVYGDDLIVNAKCATQVCAVFEAFGLEINDGKTFVTGPFRESCGGDYLYGQKVNTLNVKKLPETIQDWYTCINGVYRVGFSDNYGLWRTPELASFWERLVESLPSGERRYCPPLYGDVGVNTHDTSLYELVQSVERDNEGVPYPSRPDGLLFNSPKIKLYSAYMAGVKTHFADEVRGMPASFAAALSTHPSCKGAGIMLSKSRETFGKAYYPRVFNGKYEGYKLRNMSYSNFNQPPEDIDELFAFLRQFHSPEDVPALYPERVLENYDLKLKHSRFRLLDTLQQVILKKESLRKEARVLAGLSVSL